MKQGELDFPKIMLSYPQFYQTIEFTSVGIINTLKLKYE